MSSRPRWADGEGWRPSQLPLLEIGEVTGQEAFLLDGVVGASRFQDGRILVCNGGDRTLRYYEGDGAYLGQSAGEGGGPGELRILRRCLTRVLETWAYQTPFQPIVVFDDGGVFDRTVSMPRPDGRVANLLDVYPDGSLLLRQDAPPRELPMGESTLQGVLLRVAPGGSPVTTLGRFPVDRRVRGERLPFRQAFTPTLVALAWGGGTLVSWPEGALDIAVLDEDGAVMQRIRRASTRVPVTRAHRSAYRTRILEGPMPSGDVPFGSEDVRRAIVDMMTYPETLPTHYRILVDVAEHLWVERGDAPRDPLPQLAEPHPAATPWDVFTPEGEWLGPVLLPARFDPLEVGADYILGVHADEIGIERVRMYALERGPS